MKWVDGLRQWRKNRNSVALQDSFIPAIQEELQEYSDAKTEHDKIDALADILVFTANEIELEGYNVDLVMKQVVKHISSRMQDHVQASEWLKNGPSGKWQKWQSQPSDSLYEPDYTICRLSKAVS
jgi:hypothetical protein